MDWLYLETVGLCPGSMGDFDRVNLGFRNGCGPRFD